jgi:hypothetical protein
VHDALGVTLPVRWIFEAPTVAELATRIRPIFTGEKNSDYVIPENLLRPETIRITPDLLPLIRLSQKECNYIVSNIKGGVGNIQDIYPLAPLQQGILFHHQLHALSDPYLSHALIAFNSQARVDEFLSALQAVIDRHDILRTSVLWDQLSTPVQIVSRHALLPIETRCFDPVNGPIAEQLVEAYNTRIDLTVAPLMRVVISNDGDLLLMLLLFHHLIMDHTTLEVIV